MNDEQEPLMDERDDVGRLVRLAGKRQAVPRDRAERVKTAARAQWQSEVRRRSRRRAIWAAAGLAAAASLALAITLQFLPVGTGVPPGADIVIRVEALTGPVWSQVTSDVDGPEPRALKVGDDVPLGSELVTSDESRAAIRLASGHSVRLDASTRVRLVDRGSLALDRGTIYVDSGVGMTTTGSLEVRTPLGTLEEIGTQFEARFDDGVLRVRLREGSVVVHQGEKAHDVRAGTEISVDAGGTVTRREISAHGSNWAWLAAVTPMLDLEGRTAEEFLEWVARERGWTLSFADETVARSAGEIVLGGTVERLTLDEALDAVLPTCRMVYRIEYGTLLIAADD
jgi:ferric-dicitrate binding protein FerR (iron transport regulator)